MNRNKHLTFSFDDYDAELPRVAEHMAKHNIPATFYVCSGAYDRHALIDVIEMGHEVGAHTHSHSRVCPRMMKQMCWRKGTKCKDCAEYLASLEEHFRTELLEPRLRLEDALRVSVIGFSFPHNSTPHIRKYVKEAGYLYARTPNVKEFIFPRDLFYIWPTAEFTSYRGYNMAMMYAEGMQRIVCAHFWGHPRHFVARGLDVIDRFLGVTLENAGSQVATNRDVYLWGAKREAVRKRDEELKTWYV